MSKKLLLLFLILLFAVPSSADQKHRRKEKHTRERRLETGVSCINQVYETEDFQDDGGWWTNSSGYGVYYVNEGIDGPYDGTWAQKWGDNGVNVPILYSAVDDIRVEEHNVMSLYVKRGNAIVIRFGMSQPTSGITGLATFTWVSTYWLVSPNPNIDSYGVEDVGNDWYRMWVYIDGESDGTVGDALRPYIYPISTTVSNYYNYIWGCNITQSSAEPCMYQSNGERSRETLVLKRGVPNDFWYTRQFLDDGTPADNVATGNEFEFVDGSPHLPWWGDDMMDLERAWGITTSSDVGIVLIDIEVATPHYDLNANIYKNTNEIPGNGIDDDENGLIDDYEGWDSSSWDKRPYINDIEDDVDQILGDGSQHGTQMASIMGAVGNNENFIGYPDQGDNRQGSVGVLWDVPILAIAGKGVAGKSVPSSKPSLGLFSSTGYFGTEYSQVLEGNFRILSESYLSQPATDGQLAEFLEMILVTGAGNENSTSPQSTIGNSSDNVVVMGAVLSDGTTGNRDQTGVGAEDGSSSFGAVVDFCGYASKESRYYNFGSNGWHTPPIQYAPMFTLGFLGTDYVEPLSWEMNIPFSTSEGVGYGIIPTPGLTSGATAQGAGLLSMIMGLYPDLTIQQYIGMVGRGCITDIYDGRNVDQCADGDCDGDLGVGRISAYRSITLWGAVGDTTLSGDIYVSGDVVFTGTTFINDATFHIAPYDLYQKEIDAATDTLTCQSQYEIDYTGFTSALDSEIVVYVTGNCFIQSGQTVTFQSDALYPNTDDWGGIYTEGAGNIFELGTLNVLNTTKGEF